MKKKVPTVTKKKTDIWYLVQKRQNYYTIAIEDITAEQLTKLLGH